MTLSAKTLRLGRFALVAVALLAGTALVPAQQPLTGASREVSKKLVRLYGAGGFKGLPSYGTGIVVSPNGYILTVNNHILTTQDLRVHLHDGRVYHNCKVVFREPELDVALIKIDAEVDNLPYYDFAKAAERPVAETGDWVMALSNQFAIGTRYEPMSVQRGVIMAYTQLRGRRGIFAAPFGGDVYFTDAIANNPGAAGGAITTRRGELVGIIGRELKNTLSDTWVNYAIPVQAKIEAVRGEKTVTVSLADFVREGLAGKYREVTKLKKDRTEGDGFTGIVLVPDAVTLTPPYVDRVVPGSPAAKAGLKPDDLIVYIDGELIPSIKMYRELIKYAPPGTDLVLEVQRGNRLETVRLKVADPPKLQLPKAP
ncbi:MAG: S1C family serine protease [Gemmataceae bacterium]|nr:S1C family serine protease [Gemmataceae bacterium]